MAAALVMSTVAASSGNAAPFVASTSRFGRNRRTSSSAPNWNTSTMSPNVALTDSVFMMIALIGTTIERNVTSSRMNASASTKPNTIGRCAFMASLKSLLPAVMPVMSTVVPGTAARCAP